MSPKNQINTNDMKKLSFLAILLMLGLASCQWETIVPKEVEVPDVVSFSTDIAPVLAEKCTGCHGGGISPNLNADKSYGELTGKGIVVAGDPDGSKLMEKVNAGHGVPLSADQIAMIKKWIEDGAQDN